MPPSTSVAASVSKPSVSWPSVALLTAGALALFVTVRLLPTGTNLNHMDFRAAGKNVIEFCDPTNPQFIPVVNVRSPVAMTVSLSSAVQAGARVSGTVTLKTASGKPIGPVDLAVMHTRKLHLLIVDPALGDYQHVHPEPGRTPGEWSFSFVPRNEGVYRIFADFTPLATGRGLYSHADLNVGASPRPDSVGVAAPVHAGATPGATVDQDGYRFALDFGGKPIRAGGQADLRFRISHVGGGPVPMEPVMGAYAHLVAFDQQRSGFAHLHPNQADPSIAPNAVTPELDFRITIPNPGQYVIWAQTIIAGKEEFVPFWFTVTP